MTTIVGSGAEPLAADYLVAVDPSTGEALDPVACATPDDIDDCVRLAASAQEAWRRLPATERAGALRAAASAMRSAAEGLAALNARETGKLLVDARGGVEAAAGTLEQYAELGPLHRGRSLHGRWDATDLMVVEPRGVVAVVTPWNDPIAVAAGLVGAALVTGNAVVFKPSERCPRVSAALAEFFTPHLPADVLQVLQGGADVGERLVSHPGINLILHVGSTAAGRSIALAAARTGAAVVLENGGKDALVVDDGVDPGWAAAQAALGAFANAGQLCTAVERVYVHAGVAEPFLAALVREAGERPPGPALDQRTRLGPLIDRRQREVVHAHVRHAVADGATLLTGGVVPDGPGAYYPATVLLMGGPRTGGTPLLAEETFGPVTPVTVVEDFDAALAEASRTRYGLAATVLTPSMAHAQRAWRELDVGTVKVNAVFGGAPGGAAQPHGVSGDRFGYGPELLDEVTRVKVVHVEPCP